MRTLITRNKFYAVSTSMLALIGIFALSGCSEKSASEDGDKQAKIARREAAKAKREAAEADAPAAAVQKVSKPKTAEKPTPVEEAKTVQAAAAEKVVCSDCGVVISVKEIEVEGKGSGLGAVAGGVTGGLLGNQVGQGTGRDVATVVGVVGGAIAGHKIEQHVKKTKVYDVSVKMENGKELVLRHNTNPGVSAGEKVKVKNDLVVKN